MSDKDKIVIALASREVKGKANAKLRAAGQTPAVVYGHGNEPAVVAANSKELERTYMQAGGNKIIGLKIDDDKMKNALIHDVHLDPRTGHLLHVDFYLVRMDEKIKTEIPLHFTGESTAVYQQEGTLVRPLETVEVEALPGDLPENFEVDISVLDDFDKSITVADLKIPAGVEILTPVEELIAKVEPPRSDEELEALDEAIDEESELPEDVKEDQEIAEESPDETRKEPENRAEGTEGN